MTTHALPASLEPDQLTEILRTAGVLPEGRVTSVRSVHAFPTVLSHFHRLKLEYEGATRHAPRHLYLKTGLPGGPGAAMNSGRREVEFYSTVAPATPAGLLPYCIDAQVSPDGVAWHLLLQDLTDTHVIATQWPLPPTIAETEMIMRCRARFQVAWWDRRWSWESRVGRRDRAMAGLARQALRGVCRRTRRSPAAAAPGAVRKAARRGAAADAA